MCQPRDMLNEAESIARDLAGCDRVTIEIRLDDECFDLARTLWSERESDRYVTSCLRMFRTHALETIAKVERRMRREAAKR